jgi:hypothetical protein
MKGLPMRPDSNAINILSTTRATAKMHEFRVAPEDFIELRRNPEMLFALAVGLLGDVAAMLANLPEGDLASTMGELPVPPNWGEAGPSSIDGLRFASVRSSMRGSTTRSTANYRCSAVPPIISQAMSAARRS